jgi:pimeloyl-ACP methyl ester carboxylesterase
MDLFAADLRAVTAAVAGGRPVHLLGHSSGGPVARRALLAAPASVRSLTLLGTGSSAPAWPGC